MRNPILKIAIPSIVSNITVPLLALVDTTIVGHFGADARLTDASAEQPGAAVYLGAIAVGGMLFNMIYWLFSFLRMGTGGMTAQAYGARQTDEALRILLRSLTVATSMALLFILFKAPMLGVFFQFMEASVDTEMLARQYIDILAFGAPAVLGLYSFTGWFLGMQNAKYPMYIAIVQNIVNIGVSLWLVMALHWRVAGVAVGTLVAQYAGLLMALLLWRRHYGHLLSRHALKTLWQRGALKRFFTVNRDIFFRTLCLVGVTSCFTASVRLWAMRHWRPTHCSCSFSCSSPTSWTDLPTPVRPLAAAMWARATREVSAASPKVCFSGAPPSWDFILWCMLPAANRFCASSPTMPPWLPPPFLTCPWPVPSQW